MIKLERICIDFLSEIAFRRILKSVAIYFSSALLSQISLQPFTPYNESIAKPSYQCDAKNRSVTDRDISLYPFCFSSRLVSMRGTERGGEGGETEKE